MCVAAAIAGAAIVGGIASTVSANKAAGAAKSASNSSIAEQQREYDQARADQAPYRTAGDSALGDISKLYGLDYQDANGNTVKGSGKADFSSFTTSPDYQFESQQGQQAIDRSAAARGGLLSGATLKAGAQYANQLATTNFNDYFNHLAGVAGIGQSAANATQAAGTNAANNISNAYTNAGNARASAYLENGQTIGNIANGIGSNYLLSKYLNNGTSYPGGSGTPYSPDPSVTAAINSNTSLNYGLGRGY